MRRHVPSLDEIQRVFLERFESLPKGADRLGPSLKAVRDLILFGAARARARAGIADRKQRKATHRETPVLSTADAIVLKRVARAGRVDVRQLVAQDRSRSSSEWRFVAMWVLRRARNRSLSQIAAALGRNDHSCVVRGVRIVDQRVAREPRLRAKLWRLAA